MYIIVDMIYCINNESRLRLCRKGFLFEGHERLNQDQLSFMV